jgi:alpha-mannosidase
LAEDGSRRSAATASTDVTTRIELRAGERFLRIRVELENRSQDHRLRFHVPLARRADGSAAEGQFAVVERGLDAEGGHGEVPLPTFPARGFVDAGGVAVLLDHPLEYEVVGGTELALTLLRATGLISRNAHPWREEPAGPEIAIPDAQCRGDWAVSFGLRVHGSSWQEAAVLSDTECYQHGFASAPGTATDAPANGNGTGLEVAGEGVVLTSLRRRGGVLELRLVCEVSEPREAVVRGAFSSAHDVDLLGRPGQSLTLAAGVLRLDLAPWEIRTVALAA